jgi:hypothetical protein
MVKTLQRSRAPEAALDSPCTRPARRQGRCRAWAVLTGGRRTRRLATASANGVRHTRVACAQALRREQSRQMA